MFFVLLKKIIIKLHFVRFRWRMIMASFENRLFRTIDEIRGGSGFAPLTGTASNSTFPICFRATIDNKWFSIHRVSIPIIQ